jgi:hypothetical protein
MAFGSLRTSGKRLRLDHTFYLFFSDRRVSGPFGAWRLLGSSLKSHIGIG